MIALDAAQAADPAALDAAINARTAAIVWFHGMRLETEISLEQVIAICAARGVPVLVDAAAQVPPVENFWKFTGMGATAVIFSGGKDLRGPQASGMVLGARWLTEAMRFNGSPHGSFGRPMKVGKEEMAGLLAAVTRYLALDHEAKRARDERIVAEWCRVWNGVRGVCAARVFPNEAGQPLPRLDARLAHGVGRLEPGARCCGIALLLEHGRRVFEPNAKEMERPRRDGPDANQTAWRPVR